MNLIILNIFCLIISMFNNKLSLYMTTIMMMFCSLYSLKMLSFNYPSMKLFNTSYFMVDSVSAPLVSLTCWISSMMLLALFLSSQSNMKFSIVLLNLILILCFMSTFSIMFYIMFEMSLIPTFYLVINSKSPERYKAGMYMAFYMIFSSLPFLAVLITTYTKTGNMFMPTMLYNMNFSNLLWLIIFLPFLTKLPIYGLHIWLPKAHVEAPLVGSMILAGILLKLGGYGMMPFLLHFNYQGNLIGDWVISLSLVGGVLSSMICFRQEDIKAFIAYSSIGHMGLVLISLLSMTYWGWKGALMMMISHGLCSSALFVLASQCFDMTNSRSLLILKGGGMNVIPKLTFWWFMFCIINMGVPPTLSFYSELLMFSSILSMNKWYVIPLLFMMFLSGLYNTSLYMTSQHGKINKDLSNVNVPLVLYIILLGHLFPLVSLFLKMNFMFYSC
uniref:NADH-ubiquinone oxidoreductase chain 4 n=1 Tax=Graptacme eborea TaxID=55752 RepID=Q68SP7_GRAEB|nr:NADH dehydrogenase subunit 4 [Graptacme eborea]AAT98399.1 NADH dehydrogenase subunit 4 [Graptacme eborea]